MKQYQTDLASLMLRIALGIMFLAHGFTKLIVFTPSGTAQYFQSLGFPWFIGYLAIMFEIGGGLLLLLGILTRIVSLLAVIQMIVITFIHSVNGWSFSNAGGGWEYPAFMALTALSLVLLGSGRFSVLAKYLAY
ncbi:MAG: DoxX family protein [Gilliamella sp.]|uniref:DoxX family protein n=1 Tax=Gilliamella sp. TaxID=1891236 RepID=UPI0025D6B3D1|nr:DoxX family protein [Gilliamella sp.]MCO6537255.1 DoxX family protein [Gilliamella sp.]